MMWQHFQYFHPFVTLKSHTVNRWWGETGSSSCLLMVLYQLKKGPRSHEVTQDAASRLQGLYEASGAVGNCGLGHFFLQSWFARVFCGPPPRGFP